MDVLPGKWRKGSLKKLRAHDNTVTLNTTVTEAAIQANKGDFFQTDYQESSALNEPATRVSEMKSIYKSYMDAFHVNSIAAF